MTPFSARGSPVADPAPLGTALATPAAPAPTAPVQAVADPLDYTDRFNTTLTPTEETAFQAWAKSLGKQGSSYDYDLRGAYKAGAGQAANGHFPDTFKKPNHPTFSDQSQYSTPDTPGGAWAKQPDGSWTFTPSAKMLALHDPSDLQAYFSRVEPTNKLILPKPTVLDAVNSALQEVGK